MPGDATGVAYTWGLDGNMASRTWGGYISGAYGYDGAKRPVTLAIKFGTSSMGTIGRTYDVAGNVTSETQTLTRTGGSGTRPTLAYGQTESFTYDAANRVSGSSFDGTVPETRTYTYDADSNRTIVYEAGVTFYYFYDNTDELIKKGPNPNGTGASALAYDGLGNITTNQPGGPDSGSMLATTYTYDPAGHLLTIDDGTPAQKVVFTIDAAGRHLSQTIGTGATTTYAYLGTSDQITTTTQSGTTTYSAIDAIGDRLDQGSTSSIAGWLVPDLHGNIAAAVSAGAGPAYLTAYRYDPYGETIAIWNAASGSITVPWRFQGRMLESSASATDLYDFGARSYDPSLGAFTAFDSVAGSAQNPLTLNRYLYANANPATLVDPDGHSTQNCVVYGICLEGDERREGTIVQGTGNSGSTSRSGRGCSRSGVSADDICVSSRPHVGTGGGGGGRPSPDMTTAVDTYRHQTWLGDSWAANSHWDMGNAAWVASHNAWVPGMTSDQSARNIAAENEKYQYDADCLGGDEDACTTSKTIHVDYGDPMGQMVGAVTNHPLETAVIIAGAACVVTTDGICAPLVAAAKGVALWTSGTTTLAMIDDAVSGKNPLTELEPSNMQRHLAFGVALYPGATYAGPGRAVVNKLAEWLNGMLGH